MCHRRPGRRTSSADLARCTSERCRLPGKTLRKHRTLARMRRSSPCPWPTAPHTPPRQGHPRSQSWRSRGLRRRDRCATSDRRHTGRSIQLLCTSPASRTPRRPWTPFPRRCPWRGRGIRGKGTPAALSGRNAAWRSRGTRLGKLRTPSRCCLPRRTRPPRTLHKRRPLVLVRRQTLRSRIPRPYKSTSTQRRRRT